MKNKSVIEHYQDDVCIIPAEIKSMQTKEILAQIKQIQADKCGTNDRKKSERISLKHAVTNL